MCSLSWCRRPDGYEVFFNRDERKTRGRARPPTEAVQDGVRFLAPRDAYAGGTWLLVNEHGVTLALLNYWTDGPPPPPAALSRGQWLLRLASQPDVTSLESALDSHPAQDCGPFTLVAIDPGQESGPLVWRWDGKRLCALPAKLPLCSSSYAPSAVLRAREASFNALPDHGAEALWRWHSEESRPSATSVRMLRPDAQTWGISRITAGPAGVQWLYREEMPELAGSGIDYHSSLPLRLRALL